MAVILSNSESLTPHMSAHSIPSERRVQKEKACALLGFEPSAITLQRPPRTDRILPHNAAGSDSDRVILLSICIYGEVQRCI